MIFKAGQIVDVYPEGKDSFRACVMGVDTEDEVLHVLDLKTALIHPVRDWEVEAPLIDDIFSLKQDFDY